MPSVQLSADEVFAEALLRSEGSERANYLDQVYDCDPASRSRMERLLRAHANARSFLETPTADSMTTVEYQSPIGEGPGTVIGPYKLLQQIGEGGMGVVFMAEQMEPIQRTVALKIIKPGMDTRQVIARFEAERQALALMEHPNIARVIDAGTTTTGRPYFVMDLVKGVPITEYSDRQHLSVRERLELMTQVCQAVQHAHQKGIIHRDIKPSNVLVAEYDGKPVPKVIDFGVAKAIVQRLTERTMFTQFGQVVGTFEYMSPEQARMNELDVDTRSDIYSLGVLLYELLAGSTPLEKERLRSAAFDEILRIISEEEPPRPSTRLSSSQLLPSIAANRNLEPQKLRGIVTGELDWIVMKCLEKDRNRRYDTADSLTMDIQRHLDDENVLACPPSAAYRFRKFARRHKGSIIVAASAVVILIVLVIGLAISNRLIAAQRSLAERNFQQARQTVDDYLTLVSQTKLLDVSGVQPLRKELLELALRYYKDFAATHADDPTVKSELAAAYFRMGTINSLVGNSSQAVHDMENAAQIWESLHDRHTAPLLKANLATAYANIAMLRAPMGQNDEALRLYRNAERVWNELVAKNPNDVDYRLSLARTLDQIALALCRSGRENDALTHHDEASRHFRAALAASPHDVNCKRYLAGHLVNESVLHERAGDTNKMGRSLDRARQILEECRDTSPRSLPCQRQLADVFVRLGRLHFDSHELVRAAACYAKGCDLARQLVLQNPTLMDLQVDYANMLCDLGNAQLAVGDAAKAVDTLANARDLMAQAMRDDSTGAPLKQSLAQCLFNLASAKAKCGNVDEAMRIHAGGRGLLGELMPSAQSDESLWLIESAAIEQFAGQLRDDQRYREAAGAFQTLHELVVKHRGEKHSSAAIALGQLALVQAAAGDGAGYRTTCERLLNSFSGTADPAVANLVAWTCALRPDGTETPDDVVLLAEMACASDPSNRSFLYALGAAQFRAGRLDEAIRSLQSAINISNADSDASDGRLLAMIYCLQGNAKESRRWLDRSKAKFQDSTVRTTESEDPDTRLATDKIEQRLLLLEVEQLLGRHLSISNIK